MKAKPVIRLPGDAIPADGRPYINAGSAVFMAAFSYLVATAVAQVILWHNIPLLPLPVSDKPIAYHVYNFYAHWVGQWAHMKFSSYNQYEAWIGTLIHSETSHLLNIRWFVSTIAGVIASYYGFKSSWKVIENQKQVRGRVLLEGKEAFDDLKITFDNTIKGTNPGLILATDKGYSPIEPKTYNKQAKILRFPDDQTRTHFLYVAGSRRGKGVAIKQHIMQIYQNIRYPVEDPKINTTYKAFIVDTPKGEYAQLIDKRHMIQIAPHEKAGIAHDIAKDFRLLQDVQQYWVGRFPDNDKDPFWPKSSRGIGTGICVYLLKTAPLIWNYGNLAYWINQSTDDLSIVIQEYYPEFNNIMTSSKDTLGNVMGNFATSCLDITDLARIWDGYDYKKDIKQMTVAMLRTDYWSEWFITKFSPEISTSPVSESLNNKPHPENVPTSRILRALINHLNKQALWKWSDLKNLLLSKWEQQDKILVNNLPKKDYLKFNNIQIANHIKKIHCILEYAEIWDSYESKDKVSVREWVKDENPKKKFLVIKPSGQFDEQTKSLTRGLLYFMKSIINDNFFTDDKVIEKTTGKIFIRNTYIILDELASLGDLKGFIQPALELFASRGIRVILSVQDISQIKSIYGEDFLNFLMGNTGNVFILGSNQSETSEKISSLVGKKFINKMHVSKTIQVGGRSSSNNYQEHEAVVITPDEINSKLGTRFYPNGTGEVHYLYLPGNLPNAYILTAKLEKNYRIRYKSEPADWMVGKFPVPVTIDNGAIMESLIGNPYEEPDVPQGSAPIDDGGESHEIYEILPQYVKSVTQIPSKFTPIDQLEELLDSYDDTWKEPKKENTIQKEATDQKEREHIYTLTNETEEIGASVLGDLAIETFTNSHILSGLKSLTDIKQSATTNRTTDKDKYFKNLLKIKENKIDMETKR